ncbi:MAG TPA: creatininase family protein [Thermoplasmatales archaeon]|nr:MAG: creatininase family protein [Thermoplasmata archaeon]HDN50183.1 creatininase family protein [Thermoplasmatales archaeon]
MSYSTMNAAECSWKEIASMPKDTLFFISIGPLEAHGPHLPVATDFFIARAIEEKTVASLRERDIPCVSLPPLPLGSCRYLEGFPGTVSVEWKAVYRVLLDIFKSFGTHGFTRFMVVNFHMDLWHVKAIHRAIKKARRWNVIACEPLAPYYFRKELFEEREGEVHADVKETSIMLHLFPEMVRDYHMEPFHVDFTLLNSLKKFRELGAHDAYIGSPGEADAEYGERLFNTAVEKCIDAAYRLKRGETVELPEKMKVLLRI